MHTKAKKRLKKSADLHLPRTLHDSLVTEFTQLLNSLKPSSDDLSFKVDYLKRTWLTKFCEPRKEDTELRRQRAIEKWLETDDRNHQTNVRLQTELDTVWKDGVTFRKLITKVSEIVALVIGVAPTYDPLLCGFTGGASTSKSRGRSHPATKFLDKADATRPAWPLFRRMIDGTRLADHIDSSWVTPNYVDGSVMFTVPKTSDIDRVAAKEPDLNMFVQKSFGNQIRFWLRRVGIDLNDQTRNGELARQGSINNQLMTIDLSSASDSVTIELVRLAMPTNWFEDMSAVRSPIVEIDGQKRVMNMFSSMGNGFTFELESLLFYAITRAVSYFEGVKGTISVYGDDIIAPSAIYDSLTQALGFFGFRVNETKSFHNSPFRESCGRHWFNGYDVSPFYLRRPVRRMSDLILFLNQLTKWSTLTEINVIDPDIEDFLVRWFSFVPEYLHGGQDLSSRYSLVTGDRPRKELKPVVTQKKISHIGGLLMWLHTSAERTSVEVPLSVMDSRDSGFHRLTRNRQQWTNELPLFLSRYSSVR